MRIDILTLFPEMFEGPFSQSIIKRAIEQHLLTINIHQLRKWATDNRGTVDDKPFGGGGGMIMKVDVIYQAVEECKAAQQKIKNHDLPHTVLLSPDGQPLTQKKVQQLAKTSQLILICGRYEGVDERVKEQVADEVISIGDYVLTGGEIPAMVITDAVARLLPGALKHQQTTAVESFSLHDDSDQQALLLEYPQYTRPENFNGWKAPSVLLSGNHQQIENWRRQKAIEKTKKLRPDLLLSRKELL